MFRGFWAVFETNSNEKQQLQLQNITLVIFEFLTPFVQVAQ